MSRRRVLCEDRMVPLPRTVAKFNKVVTNRVLIRLAARPPFAALHHVGRRSGRSYRIPINAFPADDGYVFALTFGPDADWVRNVMAAGHARLEYDGQDVVLTTPRLIGMPATRKAFPPAIRRFLTVLRIKYFLRMDAA